MSVGDVLRAARLSRGLTLSAAARAAGVPRRWLALAEAGSARPALSREAAVALALGADLRGLGEAAVSEAVHPGAWSGQAPAGDPLEKARNLELLYHRWRADLLEVDVAVNEFGDTSVERLWRRCRPVPGLGPIRRLAVADRTYPDLAPGPAGLPLAAVEEHPAGLEYRLEARTERGKRVHEITFDDPGWSDDLTPGTFSLRLRTEIPGAYAVSAGEIRRRCAAAGADALRAREGSGAFTLALAYYVDRLLIRFRYPARVVDRAAGRAWDFEPSRWSVRTARGDGPLLAEESVEGAPCARHHEVALAGRTVAVTFTEPLPGHAYAVCWEWERGEGSPCES